MTYTTLLVSILTAILPLTAIAKDVKSISRATPCKQGYKAGCSGQNKIQNKQNPAGAWQPEAMMMTEEDARNIAEEAEGGDDL